MSRRVPGVILAHTHGHWETFDRALPYWVPAPGLKASYRLNGCLYETDRVLWPRFLRQGLFRHWACGQRLWLRRRRFQPGKPVTIRFFQGDPQGWIEV